MEYNLQRIIFDHLIQHKVGILRTRRFSKYFCELVSEISMLMGFEATRDLAVEDAEVETPIALKIKHSQALSHGPLASGLGMVDGMLAIVPNTRVTILTVP